MTGQTVTLFNTSFGTFTGTILSTNYSFERVSSFELVAPDGERRVFYPHQLGE